MSTCAEKRNTFCIDRINRLLHQRVRRLVFLWQKAGNAAFKQGTNDDGGSVNYVTLPRSCVSLQVFDARNFVVYSAQIFNPASMKVIFCSIIPIVALCMAGALNMSRLPAVPVSVKTDTVVHTGIPVKIHASKMWTDNATLHLGETLILHFSTPNDPYLGVIDPLGHFFYLVYPADANDGALQPFADSETFASIQTLFLNTTTLEADPYTYGVYTNQPVFTVSGDYTFILGENLHVDEPGLLHPVVIHYLHRPNESHAVAAN